MDLNDNNVIDKLNSLIIRNRLNKSQILQMVNLVSISKNFKELKENLKWESNNIY